MTVPASPEPKVGPGFPDQERDQVRRVGDLVFRFENGIGKDFRERCERFYRQYRGFRQFRDQWTRVGANDRDVMLYDAKKHWGAHLHIPLSFRTIETIVPKAIANAPKIVVAPRDEQWRKNVEAIRLLIDRQQEQINIDLALQAVMRSGRMYGLGVGKTYWRKEVIKRRRVVPKVFNTGFKVGKLMPELAFDDPMFEDLDVFDFGWDMHGSDMRTCEWTYHRIWMSNDAVLARLGEGVWNTESAKALNPDTLKGMLGSQQRYDEIWKDRMEVSGFHSWGTQEWTSGDPLHELIEFHDGERVLTVLDRQVLVQEAENPCCGMMPFQIYRPTPLSKQLVGIGDLEPIEHLNRELDTLRSQRRDAATIALCAGFAFDDGVVNEEDLVFGPNAAIRVNGNPNEALMPLQVKDVPGSGYQEEAAILRDLDVVPGLQDALAGGQPGQTQTATEAQLVQASLSARIQLGSRRFEIEVPQEAGRSFLYLDQRMILEDRPALKIPEEGVDELEAVESGAWKEYPIGPGELLGEYEIAMLGGSMAARNIPQDRADAAQLMNMFGHSWYINPTKPLERALELMGVKHPKSWMKAQEPPIPAMALSMLKLAGVDPTLIEQAVLKARTVSAPQEGPSGDQLTAMLGGSPVAGGTQGSPNGAAAPAAGTGGPK